MATQNCYYKILPKAKLITLITKDTYNLSIFVLSILNFLKLYHCCILHDYLTTIIGISACDIFSNNNILTRSIIFLPVFSSKNVLRRVRSVFPIRKKQAMIRMFD